MMEKFVTEDGYAAGYGIKNVDAWKYVSRGINLVQIPDQLYKYAVTGKRRAKFLSIRKNQRDNNEQGHADAQRADKLPVFFFILVDK